MKTILVLAHDDDGQAARLDAAIRLTRLMRGHLTCLDVTAVPELVATAGGGPEMPLLLGEEIVLERHNKAVVRPKMAVAGVEFDWVDATGKLGATMVERARLADIVVINRMLDDSEYPDMVALARDLVSGCHAPILAVPQQSRDFRPIGPAIVLWDGSPDAEAALCAAVPLLRLSSAVTLLHFNDGKVGLPLRRASEYLLQHEIIAYTAHREPTHGGAAGSIERYVGRHDPAYVVMGAFGHGRLHDAVFGSVTAHLLARSPVPLLMARRA